MKQYKNLNKLCQVKQEKQIFKEFEEKSGYNSYKVIQEVKNILIKKILVNIKIPNLISIFNIPIEFKSVFCYFY